MSFGHRSNNSEAKKLPRQVQEYMVWKFNLVLEYLNMLRCFEYYGQVNNKRVRCLRIFSPNSAQEHHLQIRTKLDLEQHSEMLLFEGYIDSQGSVYVADRRTPTRQLKVRQASLEAQGKYRRRVEDETEAREGRAEKAVSGRFSESQARRSVEFKIGLGSKDIQACNVKIIHEGG